jgi:nitrogen PTS system EIIA component
MHLSDIVTPSTVAVNVPIQDKAQALRYAAVPLGSQSGIAAEHIRLALSERELLGSTGIGDGTAVPHVSLAGLSKPFAFLFTLAHPIAFGSIDGQPVDLIFALLSPPAAEASAAPLCYLAAFARLVRKPGLAAALRNAKNPWNVCDIIASNSPLTARHAS